MTNNMSEFQIASAMRNFLNNPALDAIHYSDGTILRRVDMGL